RRSSDLLKKGLRALIDGVLTEQRQPAQKVKRPRQLIVSHGAFLWSRCAVGHGSLALLPFFFIFRRLLDGIGRLNHTLFAFALQMAAQVGLAPLTLLFGSRDGRLLDQNVGFDPLGLDRAA